MVFQFLALLCFILQAGIATAGHSPPTPRWSLILYAATDEKELAGHADPIIEKLLKAPLPDGVELLIEQDTFAPDGVNRFIRRGNDTPLRLRSLREKDSANPLQFARFAAWANQKARGVHRMLILMTHSWGWKGLVQDFTLPRALDKNTMMPVREFARVLREEEFHPDLLVLDSCILGNAEPLEEMRGISRYIVLSQRETPYGGIPYPALFELAANKNLTPREVASAMPEKYVAAYARGGSLAQTEGEYDVVSFAAVDMQQWPAFSSEFAGLVRVLGRRGFRSALRNDPKYFENIADTDSNVDLVEFLKRLPDFISHPGIQRRAAALLQQIGYPEKVSFQSAARLRVQTPTRFELKIQSDELLPAQTALEKLQARWRESNQDLVLPELQFEISEEETGRILKVSGHSEAATEVVLRPWLPGTRHISLSWTDAAGQTHTLRQQQRRDYFAVKHFPPESFLLSEAHTQGAPFIHGVGINLEPNMTADEERSLDPLLGLSGPAFYKTSAWNQKTGWGDLIFLEE